MYLLDTHALLWFLSNNPELSSRAMKAICSNVPIYVSYASFWEISIKKSIGKLILPYTAAELIEMCRLENFECIRVHSDDLNILENLPFIHRDPFDRLLISEAISKNLTIITKDNNIKKYNVKILW